MKIHETLLFPLVLIAFISAFVLGTRIEADRCVSEPDMASVSWYHRDTGAEAKRDFTLESVQKWHKEQRWILSETQGAR